MKMIPSLLNCHVEDVLPRKLFTDIQLDKMLSDNAIAVLQKTCEADEIIRRQELFALLENSEVLEKVKDCLTALRNVERALILWKDAEVRLERYYCHREVLSTYVNACERLLSLSEYGNLFTEIAGYFSSAKRQEIIARMRESYKTTTALLQKCQVGLLSFADKNWLTPDYDAVSEFDQLTACARSLGFSIPTKKKLDIRIDSTLSDAVCRLYADEIAEMEGLLGAFAEVDFYELLNYIPEFKFFLEIHDLTQRANQNGIPHCYPKVAQKPQYTAKALYDISLLEKNCEKIVPNDSYFTEAEPFYFLLGANGGGKTTYLRAIGINLVLFLAGCPVFAESAMMYPFEYVASHFPEDERFENTGRLDEELKRSTDMLEASEQKKAFLLFNETYSGTDDKRGFELLQNTAEQLNTAKHFGLYVTHFHEVMNLEYHVLSAEIDPADENRRTYHIIKSKGNASSYAADILKKYRLDKESLQERRAGYDN